MDPQGNAVTLPADHVQSPPYHQTFLKGEPKALGAVQIFLGFVHIFVGSTLLYTLNAYTSVTVYSFIYYWGAAFYIISGSLVVAAANKPSRGLVKGALATNVISALIALCEAAMVIIDLSRTYYYNYGPCYTNPCSLFQDTILVIRLIALLFMVFISFLQFSICATAFAFSIRSLKQKTPQVIIVQNIYQNPAVIPEASAPPEK